MSGMLQVRHPDSPLQLAAPRSCPAGSCCELSRLHVERLLLLEGLWEVEVIDGCHCSTWPEECLRLPALNTFPDSPWEVKVDVGKCSDLTYSADGLFCMSTKFNTALVKTPQGGEVVRTLENCEMKEKGYRVSQEIDAGRCLGSCSSGDPCLLRESQSRKKCLVWAEAASGHCTPHRYDIHTFRSRRERARTVVAIRQRKCRG